MIVSILAEGFQSDPFMSWIFQDEASRPEALARWFTHWIESYGDEGHTMVLEDSAAALWAVPNGGKLSREAEVEVARIIGHYNGDRTRYVLEGLGPLGEHPEQPYWYLNAIATRGEARGGGFGARLLGPSLERADAEGLPVYLESSNPRNLTFYRRHGFEPQREAIVLPDGGPSIQPMWREPRRAGS